ncbi:MAG: class I SAM-dependent methyltransferase [Parcubacteria group bacterium]
MSQKEQYLAAGVEGRKLNFPSLGYWYTKDNFFWNIFENYKKNKNKNPKIHEVGAGLGTVSKALISLGYEDISLSDIDDCRVDEGIKKLPFSKVDLSFDRIPFDDNTLDIISAGNLVEHLENPFHFYRECFRTLKPGGVVIITTVIGWNIISRLLFLRKNILEGYHSVQHITFQPKDKFEYATRMFNHSAVFFQQRTEIFIFGFRIPLKFPKNERWSPRMCIVLEKPTK